jgi:DNA-binding CsgD family transcriptional regulator
MVETEPFNDAIESIYAAAVKPAEWASAMQKIARLHQGERAALLTPSISPDQGGYIVPYNLSEETLRAWPQYVDQDPWVAAAVRQGVVKEGFAWTGDDLVPDEQLVASSYYRNFLSTVGIRWLLTGCVFNGDAADMPLTVCAVYNAEAGFRFGPSDTARHRLLLRHLSRAIGAMYKLRDLEFKAATSIQALDRLPNAVLLLGSRGNVIFSNKAAYAILGHADGLKLRSGHPLQDGLGWLRAATPAVQTEIDRTLARTLVVDAVSAPHFSEAVQIPRPSGKQAYLMRACPLSAHVDFADSPVQASGMVFLSDPDAVPLLDAAALAKVYGLTAAEIRVAQQLLAGKPVAQVALSLGIVEATAKTHIRKVLQKTNTARQPQLIRLLMSLCVG